MCSTTKMPATEKWLVMPEDLKVGDRVVEDYLNVRGLTIERVSRSTYADGRHGDECNKHWLIAFEGKDQMGHCYRREAYSFRRVVSTP